MEISDEDGNTLLEGAPLNGDQRLWLALAILSMVFEVSILPTLVLLLVWGVMQVTYSLECIRLGREEEHAHQGQGPDIPVHPIDAEGGEEEQVEQQLYGAEEQDPAQGGVDGLRGFVLVPAVPGGEFLRGGASGPGVLPGLYGLQPVLLRAVAGAGDFEHGF